MVSRRSSGTFQVGHEKHGGRAAGTKNKRASIMATTMRALEFDPKQALIKIFDDLERFNQLCLNQEDHFRYGRGSDYLDIVDRQNAIAKILMPYIHSRKPQEVVQHNINTDEPNVERAREAVLKAMRRVKDDDAE